MMKNTLFITVGLAIVVCLLGGCATTRYMAIPSQQNDVDPSGTVATLTQGQLTLRVRQVESPRGMRSSITAFELTVINPTETVIEFIPKEFVLFTETGNQFFPLNPDALLEAANASTSRSSVYMGYGYGSHYSRGYVGYNYGFGPPLHYHRPRYEGVIARAFPLHPVPVYPGASVSGRLYFPFAAKDVDSPRLQIVRYIQAPSPDMPPPQEAIYPFSFIPKE